jgi:hypothetical protein
MLAPETDNHTGRKRVFNHLRRCQVRALSIAATHGALIPPNSPRRDEWDNQIKEDVKAGKLDNLIEEARRDHRQGNTKPLP